MSISEEQAAHQNEQEQPPGGPHLPILALIESLHQSCRAGTPPEAFRAEVLRGFVSISDAAYGAFWRLLEGGEQLGVDSELAPSASSAAAAAWGAVLREIAAGVIDQPTIRYRAVGEPAGQLMTGQKYVALGFPVRGEGESAGAITVVVNSGSVILTDAGLAMLRLLADLGLLYAASRRASRFERSYRSLSGAWELLGEVLAFHKPQEMAQVLANRSRAAFGADRVAVGLVTGQKVSVAAISGEDLLDKRSNVLRMMRAAQSEVVVSDEPGMFVNVEDGQARAEQTARNPQHEKLARERDLGAVVSLPLRKGQDLVGVWTLEFGSGQAFEEGLRRVLEVTAGQVGPVLHLARRDARGIFRRARDGIGEAARWIFGREHPWRRAAGVAALGALAFAVFGKADFNAAGNCTLTPALRRIYAAPFDTTIGGALVEPGETVVEGQPLVEFDREEIEIRLREARSNLTGAQKQMATFLVEQKMPQYAEARARADALEAEVELLERRLERAVLRAEFPGIVLKGDLRQDVGRSVRMGEELLELAPLEDLVLEVEVDQGEVAFVEQGQQGRFSTKARPGVAIPFIVQKVRPTPEVRGGDSVYVAEATVPNPEGWLRPGMEGAAKVSIGRRNVVWVWTRKLRDWVRLRVWRWWGK